MQITIRYRPIDWNAWLEDLAPVSVMVCIYGAFALGFIAGLDVRP